MCQQSFQIVYKRFNTAASFILILVLILPWFTYVKGVDAEKKLFQFSSLKSQKKIIAKKSFCSTGLTRSIKSFYNGFYKKSLEYNRSGPLMVILLIAELLFRLIVCRLKSQFIAWLDLSQILFIIILSGIILELNFCDNSVHELNTSPFFRGSV